MIKDITYLNLWTTRSCAAILVKGYVNTWTIWGNDGVSMFKRCMVDVEKRQRGSATKPKNRRQILCCSPLHHCVGVTNIAIYDTGTQQFCWYKSCQEEHTDVPLMD